MHRVVPELILENYRNNRMGGEFPAVGMFLDLSGFSRMTDTLMQHGGHGAEVLAGLMHSVFNPLVKSIFDYGGKIVSFAGDGITALYPIDANEKVTTVKALASAWIIQNHLLKNPERATVYGTFSFSVKIGLTVGPVSWRILRSKDGKQATYYCRGAAVNDAARAEHSADAGEIILTQSVVDILGTDIHSEPRGNLYRFTGFTTDIPSAVTCSLPPVDVKTSRLFMPENVIVHNIRGEFRQIVNLFMRIPDLSDEKLEGFLNTVFELRKQYGGLLTRLDFGDKGCNMLILWGAPVAYENDVNRALNFILDLQAQVDFPITAGVTYYIAHAGYLGSEMCEDYTCYGWGVNLASRFMMSAPDGAIWVDARVAHKVLSHFVIDPVGSQPFKGFTEEQEVNVLKGRRSEQMDVIYHGELVGRDDILAQLKTFVAPLWDGSYTGVVALAGEAGIGKSRVVHAFRSSDVFNNRSVLWMTCPSDQILKSSFHPLRRALIQYFDIKQEQAADERRRAFDAKLDDLLASLSDLELASELNRTRSFLGALVDVTWDDSLYSQLDAEGRYNNTFLGLIALVKAESVRQPVIIFFDDVHFVDADTETFLSQLKRSLSANGTSYPVAILLAYRAQEMNQVLRETLPDTELQLGGVRKRDISHLAETLLGGRVSPTLLESVVSRSEGNPYFAEQVLRYLQDENLLEMTGEGWKQISHQRFVLPGDIRALLVARLDQLEQQVKTVVQTASVLGREFEARVLMRIMSDDLDVMAHVHEAEKASVWALLSEMRYIFHHGLLRDAAYTMQMRARRRELHKLTLMVLEKMYENDPSRHYAELAYHAENAEDRIKAHTYYMQAGKFSSEQYQNSLALEYFTKALEFISPSDLAGKFDLVAERIEVYSRMGKRDLQLGDLNSLEEWANVLSASERIAKVLMLRATYNYFVGNYQGALEQAQLAWETSEPLMQSASGFYMQVVAVMSLLYLGRVGEAMQYALRVLDTTRRFGNRKEECRILTAMGLVALEDKVPANAQKHLIEAVKIARELNDLSLEARALNNLAISEGSVMGNYAQARKYYEESYKLTREIGDRHAECTALSSIGFVAGMEGDFVSAYSYQEQSLKIAREIGSPSLEMYALINLSALAAINHDAKSALHQAQQAAVLAQKTSQRSLEAWAMLYMGHAYSLQNDLDVARFAYQRSVDIRNELNQPALSMEPLSGLVESYLHENNLDFAFIEVEKILDYLKNGGTLDGTEEPLRVYYTCYLVLDKKSDARAIQVLKKAGELLEAQVSKFSNNAARQRFIENIPWRRAIYDLTRS